MSQWQVARSVRAGTRYAVVLAMLVASTPGAQSQLRSNERSLSGTVTDASHEPIRGAVVQLEDETSERVMTFITDADGHYEFKHLQADDDYRLSAKFRDHKSKVRELSKFSSKTTPVVRLVIRLD